MKPVWQIRASTTASVTCPPAGFIEVSIVKWTAEPSVSPSVGVVTVMLACAGGVGPTTGTAGAQVTCSATAMIAASAAVAP
ncbi:MAG TPA: hypothetical protein VEP49_18655 [Acidimicrobiia bacterium]|nr:hypothetical protein [Acidimicrobiia bacterium]